MELTKLENLKKVNMIFVKNASINSKTQNLNINQ